MPERSYEGKALDATMTHLSEIEEPGQESNASGQEKTSFGRNKTDLQKEIIRQKMMNPDATVRGIANNVGCDYTYVHEVLKQREEEPYARYRHDSWSGYTDKQKKIIKMARVQEEFTKADIAEEVGVSGALVTKVLKANQHLVGDS